MLLTLGLLLATSTAPMAMDATRPPLQVLMVVEPDVLLDDDDLRAIASNARRIWAPVLDVVVNTPADLRRPVAVESIRLTITNRTLDSREGTGLGWIEFVNDEPQTEITVSAAAATRLLNAGTWRGVRFAALPHRASRLFLQRALARAVAHEIGHYLLRSRVHGRRGLMRAVFTADEIMDTRTSLDRLEPAQVERLRQAAGMHARNAA